MAGQAAKKQSSEKQEIEKLRKKAEAGDAVAQNQMGDLHWDGLHGVEKNQETAFEWFSKAAEQGNADAEYSMGFAFLSGQGAGRDLEQGRTMLHRAAEKGHAKSMRQLAQVHFSGMGVPQSTAKAVELWSQAASAGDVDSIAILGKLYSVGIPGTIEQDHAKAFELLKKAAASGDSNSMHLLGQAYEHGKGCSANEKEAMQWYARADAKGYVSADSHHMLGINFYKQKKMGEAAKCFMAAARARHPVAAGNIARFFYWGRGVEQDYHMAFHWANEAVKLGETDAAQTVAMCHEYGNGTAADHQLAMQWYLFCIQGTEEANIKAQCMDGLGRCAYKGSHHDYVQDKVPEDFSQAAYWWGRAAELGVKDAMNRLAKLHYRGRGVPKDVVKAKELWGRAAAKGCEEAKESLRDLEGYSVFDKLKVWLPTLLVALLLIIIVAYFAIQYHEMSKDSWFAKMPSEDAPDEPPSSRPSHRIVGHGASPEFSAPEMAKSQRLERLTTAWHWRVWCSLVMLDADCWWAASEGTDAAAAERRQKVEDKCRFTTLMNGWITLVVALLLLTIVAYFAIQYHEMSKDSWFAKMPSEHAPDEPPPARPPTASSDTALSGVFGAGNGEHLALGTAGHGLALAHLVQFGVMDADCWWAASEETDAAAERRQKVEGKCRFTTRMNGWNTLG
eukprot:CAMPEP_0196757584 /NCGR_PEP_ID=MMETSP1091-20130531/103740_1 /TAXON_ID=302021 /ORGANISM="Rhodomonas sp., Strain CCMP768" /LENGTH=673 /DNA_ID=CAMNT_0042106367 /DNA_START=36 /DNA_END=2055 /DNA_ORIENTATION=+